jgi:NADH-quinone oxidoreductase subunit E
VELRAAEKTVSDLTKSEAFCYKSNLIFICDTFLLSELFDGHPVRRRFHFRKLEGLPLASKKQDIQSVIRKHKGLKKNLIAILLDIQAQYNYLPPESLRYVAAGLDTPLIDIVGVATFYRAFSLTPRGKHTCLVCTGTACHVRGGSRILDEFERKLEVGSGQTTKDGQVTLETVACLGCCAIGPVVVVDGEYHRRASIRNVGQILGKYRKPETPPAKPQKSRPAKSPAS